MLRLRQLGAALVLLTSTASLPAASSDACPAFAASEAWDEVRSELAQNYAYWDRIDAERTFDAAAPVMRGSTSRLIFADRLQALLLLFGDSHLHVSPTSDPAMAWAPSASDMWFGGTIADPVVQDVKQGSVAAERGIRPGMHLREFGGQTPAQAVAGLFADLGVAPDVQQSIYALNALATGRLKQPRSFVFRDGKRTLKLELPPGYDSVRRPAGLAQVATAHDASGHIIAIIRVNNSLGENALIAEFDRAIGALPPSAHVILDLRDTPSGGNSTVARSIIGHFITEPKPYQRHELTAERIQFGVPRVWLEYAQPRAPHLNRPIVLAGMWTGSMGEGLTIGLNSAAGAPVVGSPMGQLLGAIIQDELPKSCLTVSFANERLWHVDGTPRENFVPTVAAIPADAGVNGEDTTLNRALALIDQSDRQAP